MVYYGLLFVLNIMLFSKCYKGFKSVFLFDGSIWIIGLVYVKC